MDDLGCMFPFPCSISGSPTDAIGGFWHGATDPIVGIARSGLKFDSDFFSGNFGDAVGDLSGTLSAPARGIYNRVSDVISDPAAALDHVRHPSFDTLSQAAGAGVFGGVLSRVLPAAGAAEEAGWGNPATLERHFADHGADFGSTSAEEYAQSASDFFKRSQIEGLPTKIDGRGVIRVYDPNSNTFGSYNANGTTRTFFKPDPAEHGLPTNLDYWNIQPGDPPWQP